MEGFPASHVWWQEGMVSACVAVVEGTLNEPHLLKFRLVDKSPTENHESNPKGRPKQKHSHCKVFSTRKWMCAKVLSLSPTSSPRRVAMYSKFPFSKSKFVVYNYGSKLAQEIIIKVNTKNKPSCRFPKGRPKNWSHFSPIPVWTWKFRIPCFQLHARNHVYIYIYMCYIYI